ncbi:MAG: NADP-dependent malic enzyme [Candidatus Vogelbacteria bacterium]|nr:NADP-dependent malic enzyme [Candidatus Vogelbacteria bacterium]
MKNINKESIALHKKHAGKIEIAGKIPVKNREDLLLAYTPGVGAVCLEIFKDPKKVYDLTIKKNMIAVVSDGSAVLGLGNLGPLGAIPVMEGKALLFKTFGGVDAFPICLATQDVEEIIKTVKNIAPIFGGINLEDISAPRCFEVERRLRAELDIPVMHDDQHGTSVVVLAGLINSLKLRKSRKENVKIIINGVGAAGTAIAKLLLCYGFKNIILCDSQGAITETRGDIGSTSLDLARGKSLAIKNPKLELINMIKEKTGNYENVSGGLATAINGRDIFIGVSKAGVLTEEMVKSMNAKPIIFAMANPVPEIMPDIAERAGAFIIATGRSDFPNQLNNVLGFPGIFRGAIDKKIKQFTPEMFVCAAEKLAGCVKKPNVNNIIPGPFDKNVVKAVASAIK